MKIRMSFSNGKWTPSLVRVSFHGSFPRRSLPCSLYSSGWTDCRHLVQAHVIALWVLLRPGGQQISVCLLAVSMRFLPLFCQHYALGPSKSAIEVEQVIFNGSPSFTEDGRIFIPNPGPVKYVGDPSPEIDEAWEYLTASPGLTHSSLRPTLRR